MFRTIFFVLFTWHFTAKSLRDRNVMITITCIFYKTAYLLSFCRFLRNENLLYLWYIVFLSGDRFAVLTDDDLGCFFRHCYSLFKFLRRSQRVQCRVWSHFIGLMVTLPSPVSSRTILSSRHMSNFSYA